MFYPLSLRIGVIRKKVNRIGKRIAVWKLDERPTALKILLSSGPDSGFASSILGGAGGGRAEFVGVFLKFPEPLLSVPPA